jgi:hypothetical protein
MPRKTIKIAGGGGYSKPTYPKNPTSEIKTIKGVKKSVPITKPYPKTAPVVKPMTNLSNGRKVGNGARITTLENPNATQKKAGNIVQQGSVPVGTNVNQANNSGPSGTSPLQKAVNNTYKKEPQATKTSDLPTTRNVIKAARKEGTDGRKIKKIAGTSGVPGIASKTQSPGISGGNTSPEGPPGNRLQHQTIGETLNVVKTKVTKAENPALTPGENQTTTGQPVNIGKSGKKGGNIPDIPKQPKGGGQQGGGNPGKKAARKLKNKIIPIDLNDPSKGTKTITILKNDPNKSKKNTLNNLPKVEPKPKPKTPKISKTTPAKILPKQPNGRPLKKTVQTNLNGTDPISEVPVQVVKKQRPKTKVTPTTEVPPVVTIDVPKKNPKPKLPPPKVPKKQPPPEKRPKPKEKTPTNPMPVVTIVPKVIIPPQTPTGRPVKNNPKKIIGIDPGCAVLRGPGDSDMWALPRMVNGKIVPGSSNFSIRVAKVVTYGNATIARVHRGGPRGGQVNPPTITEIKFKEGAKLFQVQWLEKPPEAGTFVFRNIPNTGIPAALNPNNINSGGFFMSPKKNGEWQIFQSVTGHLGGGNMMTASTQFGSNGTGAMLGAIRTEQSLTNSYGIANGMSGKELTEALAMRRSELVMMAQIARASGILEVGGRMAPYGPNGEQLLTGTLAKHWKQMSARVTIGDPNYGGGSSMEVGLRAKQGSNFNWNVNIGYGDSGEARVTFGIDLLPSFNR